MSGTRRREVLLNTLMAANGPVTVKHLAALLKASPRTVRYDLDDLGKWLAQRNITLVRRPRRGIWLEGDVRIASPPPPGEVGALRDSFMPAPERQALAMARLLAGEGPEPVRQLSALLGVTRTTVYRELQQMAGQLEKRSLRLQRARDGVRVDGLEVNRRRALYELLQQWVLDADLKHEVGDSGALRRRTGMRPRETAVRGTAVREAAVRETAEEAAVPIGVRLLRELTDRQPTDLRALVAEAAEATGYPLTPGQVVGLLFWCAVTDARLRLGHHVLLPERPALEAMRLNEYRLAVEVLRRLGHEADGPNADGPNAYGHEASFLAMNARDARYGPAELHNRQVGAGPNRAREAALEFTRQAGFLLGVELSQDEDLIRGLILHLEPAIDRLELGVIAPNPLLDEIKAKYSGLYAVARRAAESLSTLPAGLADEEVGYLAVHLGAALERLSDPASHVLRAVLVCEHGVGTAQLLASTLTARLPELQVCGFASSHGVDQAAADCGADVILTTRPLVVATLPVFLVHPLPDVIELTALRARLQSLLRRPRGDDRHRLHATNGGASPLMLEDVLTEQTVALDVEAKDWQDAIRKVGDLMVKAGAVRPEYVDGMIRTVETIGPYVVVGPGIAMPHARPEDGAVNVGMACVRLARPVAFAGKEDNPIDLLFSFAAIDNQSHVAVMGQLARLLSTPSLVERVRRARTVADVLEVVHTVSAT